MNAEEQAYSMSHSGGLCSYGLLLPEALERQTFFFVCNRCTLQRIEDRSETYMHVGPEELVV